MTQWHFYEPVYRRWVVLQLSSYEDFQEEMRDCGFEGAEDLQNAKSMCIDLRLDNNTTGQNCTFIWLPKWDVATLVHEITHMVMMNFDNVGVPISRDNTESFAFYCEYWYTEITRVRRRMPNGRTPTQARANKKRT